MSTRNEETPTRVERAGDKWLVNTPATEAIMAYDRHDSSTKLKLLNQTMFLVVPQGATVHIGDIVLHHLNSDRHDTEIEIMDAFQGHNLTIDTAIQQQLLAEGTRETKGGMLGSKSEDKEGITVIREVSNFSKDPTVKEPCLGAPARPVRPGPDIPLAGGQV
ncbi:unnamed protein product [Pleuronectes platessa]|uniref:Uncharacterized protein n=1 Tax=Pleuronectes platessa TaxID=8262 RepID=A0A9N7U118_PLEPL|nr:unnamed protein product [Pleuronectes platessa]